MKLEVLITLPDWQPTSEASRKLKAGWAEYVDRLHEHELGHRAIGLQAAAVVRDALLTVGSQRDCVKLMKDANLAGEIAVHSFKHKDREYDRQTDHGAARGVELPW